MFRDKPSSCMLAIIFRKGLNNSHKNCKPVKILVLLSNGTLKYQIAFREGINIKQYLINI